MLAQIYNWFTEGFDIADLKDAKAPLDQLETYRGQETPVCRGAITSLSAFFSLFILHNLLSAGLSVALPQGGWSRALLPNIDQSTGLAFE